MDFNEDIYGDRMEFEFIEYMRPNYKFESEGDLISQLLSDRIAAKEFISKN